jgi:16S rRNA processing protein RimM
MSEKDCRVLLGRIAAAHGIGGDVLVHSYAADPADIAAYGPLSTGDGARQIELKVLRVTAKGVIARVSGVTDRNGAEALKGVQLYVDRARLPKTGEDEFYQADLVGLAVEDEAGNALGTVAAVANYGAGDLLELRLKDKRATELVPFTQAFVPVVDFERRRVVVRLPAPGDDAEGDEAAG